MFWRTFTSCSISKGGLAQMVERSLSMWEVPGSMPGSSNLFFFWFFLHFSHTAKNQISTNIFVPLAICIFIFATTYLNKNRKFADVQILKPSKRKNSQQQAKEQNKLLSSTEAFGEIRDVRAKFSVRGKLRFGRHSCTRRVVVPPPAPSKYAHWRHRSLVLCLTSFARVFSERNARRKKGRNLWNTHSPKKIEKERQQDKQKKQGKEGMKYEVCFLFDRSTALSQEQDFSEMLNSLTMFST